MDSLITILKNDRNGCLKEIRQMHFVTSMVTERIELFATSI